MTLRRAFSLLEVLMALGALAIALLALLGLVPVAFRQRQSSIMMSQSLYLASETMDELLQRNEVLSTVPQTDQPFPQPVGTRSWWGAPEPGGRAGLQMVTVEVTWAEGAVQHRVRLQSLVCP